MLEKCGLQSNLKRLQVVIQNVFIFGRSSNDSLRTFLALIRNVVDIFQTRTIGNKTSYTTTNNTNKNKNSQQSLLRCSTNIGSEP